MKLIFHDGKFFAPSRIVSIELRCGKWHILGDGGSFYVELDPKADSDTVTAVLKNITIVNKESIIKK